MPSNARAVDERYAASARAREANLALLEEALEDQDEPVMTGRHASDGNITPTAHRKPKVVEVEVLRYNTATSARGYVQYFKVRPDKSYHAWICDDCYRGVQPSQFMTHAEEAH